MRNKDLSGGEWPVTRMWYGKMAGHTIEDIIENNVSYFIWMVKAFQDVTVKQAKFFRKKWEMDLPEEVIKDVVPYTYSRKAPEKEYERLCQGLIDIKDTYMVKLQSLSKPIQTKDVSQVINSSCLGEKSQKPTIGSTGDSPNSTYDLKVISPVSSSSPVKSHSPKKLKNIPRSKAIPPPEDAPKGSDEYKRWLYFVYGRNRDILPNYGFNNQREP